MPLIRAGFLVLIPAMLWAVPARGQASAASARFIVGANHRASGEGTADRAESWIAVSATNPKALVAVSHDGIGCEVMNSTDGGATWSAHHLRGYCMDPMVTSSAD